MGKGPYSSAVGATGQAFLASSIAKSTGEKDWPDFQLTMAHSTESYFIVDNATSLFPEKIEVPMSVQAFLGRPKSRGSIKLNPEDPNGPPLIDPQHLMDPRDMQIALDGVKETIRIMETTESYKRLGARFSIVELEDCKDLPERSDEFLICYIKHLSRIGCHPSGSNKMGKGSQDPTAVVDSQLRVIGIDGLRVADASVMPTIVNANTQAAVYAIAERVSELILQRWQPSKNTRYGRYRFERKHYGW
ncbi:unnamed protein product [Orchesella dallaii]|uniref:Glucose-methanol-choline oxidoreductase C-terminal domain-containing protein n=1 Tax=Orchesella dallaii TaxID=48710 RepID=A0ABP1RBH4_9HEXA